MINWYYLILQERTGMSANSFFSSSSDRSLAGSLYMMSMALFVGRESVYENNSLSH